MAPAQVTQWISATYPKPTVDNEWLDACCDWIQEDLNLDPATQTAQFIQNVDDQLLESDFKDSMVHGTGFPPDVLTLNNVRLTGPPILVEIVAIMEIGQSAFSLQNVRQTRVDREDLAGLAGSDEDAEDEGPIPKYTRSMLRLELSDGTSILPAIEYRRLPELELGVTPPGYKMLLKDVMIRRGIAFLEPENVVMKGHKTEEREANQDSDFVRALRRRLGIADTQEQPDAADAPAARAPPPAQNAAQPDQNQMPPHERADSPDATFVNAHQQDRHDNEEPPLRRRVPARRTSPPPSSATAVASQYFPASSSTLNSDLDARTGTLPRVQQTSNADASDDFDFGDDDMDAAFLEEVAAAEQQLLAPAAQGGSSSSVAPGPRRSASIGASVSARSSQAPSEVIEIDDDDDKENVPVTSRRVRRRTVPAPDDSDVIDISD